MFNFAREPDFTFEQITNAYVYLLGRYLIMRQEILDLAADDANYNQLEHHPALIEGGAQKPEFQFVSPNLDVVYSEAWLLLEDQAPVLLQIPKIPKKLYYTVQICDEWGEVLFNINRRTYPQAPQGKFLFCLKNSEPEIPIGCIRLDLPSPKAKIIIRLEIGSDLEKTVTLQHQFHLQSQGKPEIKPPFAIPLFAAGQLPGAEIFNLPSVEAALATPDACPEQKTFHPLIREIASWSAKKKKNAKLLAEVIYNTVWPAFFDKLEKFGKQYNGWTSTRQYQNFGDDFWFRAITNYVGIWWNSSSEVVYFLLNRDNENNPPDSNKNYQIRFGADWVPTLHVDGFWSITMYEKPGFTLAKNRLGRYHLGSNSELVYEEDGSLILYFGPECPDGVPESNWLPTPKTTPFTLNLRMYLPKKEVLEGDWFVPGLI